MIYSNSNISILIIVLIFFSCSNKDVKYDSIEHPNVSLIINDEDTIHKIINEEIKLWSDHFELKNKGNLLELDISDNQFGVQSFTDVLILENELLVLDQRQNKLHSINFEGFHNDPISISGRGPGELSEPLNMIKLDIGFAAVDKINGILLFNENSEYIANENIGFMPDYVCKLQNNYVAKTSYLTLEDEIVNYSLFMIDSNQEIVNKFSQRYQHHNNMLVYYMTDGPIECITSKQLIVNFFKHTLPVIEIIDISTNKEIVYYFKDLNPFLLNLVNNSLQPSKKNYGTTYHTYRSSSVIKDRFIIVQYREVDRPDDPNDNNYDQNILSYIIDLNLNDVYYSYDFPIIVTTSNERMLIKHNDKLSKFSLFEYEINKL